MHARKQRMFTLADAFIVLPGGLGTLDETFEVLTWKQLGLHDKPIVLIDLGGYWRPLHALIAHLVEEGFAPANAEQFLGVVASVDFSHVGPRFGDPDPVSDALSPCAGDAGCYCRAASDQ